MNLVEAVRGYATAKFAESISAVLGITPERITVTLDAAIPALVAAIASRSQTPEDAHTLARTLTETDESVLADPAAAVRTHGAALINHGGDLLGSILGGASLTTIIGGIGRYTGKSPGSVRSIVGLLAPVVLGIIRRQQTLAKLDEAGLSTLLAEQRPHVAASLPQGLARTFATAPNAGPLGEYLKFLTAAPAAHHAATAPPRPLLHVHAEPGPEPGPAAHAHGSGSSKNGHTRTSAPKHANGHQHGHHRRRRAVPAWIWAAPAAGVLGLGWLIIAATGGSARGVADADAAEVVPASAPVTPETLRAEIDSIIDGSAVALGSVRDAATADAAAPALRELNARLDAAKRIFDRLPRERQRDIAHRVSAALATRLRNGFERVHGSDGARERIGSLSESLMRRLRSFRAEE